MTRAGDNLPGSFAFARALQPRRAPSPLRRTHRPPWIVIQVAFALFVASFPFEGFTFGGSSLPRVIGFAFVFFALIQPDVTFRRPPAAFWYFSCFLVVFVLRGWLGGPADGAELRFRSLLLVQLLFVLWIASNLLRYPKVFFGVLSAFVASCVLLSALQIAGLTAEQSGRGRETTVSQDPNNVGAVLALGLVAAAGIAYGRKRAGRFARLAIFLVFAFISVAVVRTGSRGAIVSLAVGLTVLILRRGSAWVRFRNVLLVLTGLAVLAVMVSSSEVSSQRWESTLEGGSLAGREKMYPIELQMFLERPLVGWGCGVNNTELGRRLGQPPRDTHTTYLWVLTEDGLLGGIPYFFALFLCVRSAWRARRSAYGLVPLALVAEILIVSLTLNWQYRKVHWLVLGLALASDRSFQLIPRRRPSGGGSLGHIPPEVGFVRSSAGR